MTREDIRKSEEEFEREVIEYLQQIGEVKQWEYKKEIKTSEQLWNNFKIILENNNRARLKRPLSETEFKQVQSTISNLNSPYEAGQFLYGVNGVSEINIISDDGESIHLTVFDQAQVGGGNTVYQIVNQIERPKIVDGKQDRRFDVTLLINGLPIIQMELKKIMKNSREALNQIEQYIAERQYSDIYSTTQILVAMTPNDIKYMANVTIEQFNTAFAFNWQDENTANPVRSWKTFCDKVLSIPMAHDLATRYMILDGTKNKKSIKVMRPYQVYATKRVLDSIKKYDFKHSDGKLGYVWHTTGAGKTVTSFKTAWLASRLPNVDKVVFLVDRIALTNQTFLDYDAYDPTSYSKDNDKKRSGVIAETHNVRDLHKKLTKKSDSNIIVTSIQKMSRYVKGKYFKKLDEKILFIVDEAHRSTVDGTEKNKDENQGMLESIRKAIPNAAWIGYTGTPKFPETSIIFGNILHTYTIKEAISDKNVLGFNVEFKETIEAPSNPTAEDIDDNIKASVYDTSTKHVELVVKDIFDNWNRRSVNRKYNGMLTVHVGGNRPSIPRAIEYYNKFMEENEKRAPENRLKVGISFSLDTTNSSTMLYTNESLHKAIKTYNSIFNTSFDMSSVKEYTEDFATRLNKTADDRKYLDLGIVVDQFLTGFNAPELNTLYVDRILKGSALIQAYSRTNRIHHEIDKPWGNIINYRWPIQNEEEMNKSLAIYSNRQSAAEQQSIDVMKEGNRKSGILSKDRSEVVREYRELVRKLSEWTSNFTRIPRSEKEQDLMFEQMQTYNKLASQYKQITSENRKIDSDTVDNDRVAENDYSFYYEIGITPEEEIILTTVLAEELKEKRAKRENIDISQVNLNMIHIHDVNINYDYLTELIARMADEIRNNQYEEARKTREDIYVEISKSENIKEKADYREFSDKIFNREFEFDQYPAPTDNYSISIAMEKSRKDTNIKKITVFIRKWGLDNAIIPRDLSALIDKHRFREEDLDKMGELSQLLNLARNDYPELADEDIAKLSWIRYRNQLRKAIYDLADEIKKGE